VAAAVSRADAVIHLAAVLPPRAYEAPTLAASVNRDGALAVIEAVRASGNLPPFIYTSSAAVYGVTQGQPPPVRPDQSAESTDAYTRDKLAVEEAVREQSFPWVILRLSHVPILGLRMPHRVMFDIPLDNRMELLHADDAALAVVNALEREAAHRRTLLIGGGTRCRILYGQYLERALRAMGLDMPPAWAFGSNYHYSDWLDTAESQALLGYQRHSFDDIIAAIAHDGRRLRPFIRAFAPALTRALARSSPQRNGGSST
jgi:UDP-glucose 4-epimerase